MNVLAPAPSRCATDATAAVPSAMRTGSVPTRPTSRADDRLEQAGVVHDAEIDHREGQERRNRRHAADPVHGERSQAAREPADERSDDRHERERDQDRGDAEQDEQQQGGDRRDAEQREHDRG